MENKTLKYSIVFYDAKKRLGLSMNEYIICNIVEKLQLRTGYAYASLKHYGDCIDVSNIATHNIIKRCIQKGVLENIQQEKGKTLMLKVTEKWIKETLFHDENSVKESLIPPKESVKETLMGVKESLMGVKESLINNNIYNNIYNNNNNIYTPVEKKIEEIWNEYPSSRRVDKKKIFEKLRKLKDKLDFILERLKQHKESSQWKNENGKYIPLISTWINQERWEQELEKEKTIII